MQSSSLLPSSSVRSFRVHAPRQGPPLALVVAVGLLILGGLAGALALDWTGGVVNGVRDVTGWPGPVDADEPFDGPIAMPMRIPLDPVLLAETASVAVAEIPAATPRVESDGGPIRAIAAPVGETTAAPAVSSVPPVVGEAGAVPATPDAGSSPAPMASAAPDSVAVPAAPAPSTDAASTATTNPVSATSTGTVTSTAVTSSSNGTAPVTSVASSQPAAVDSGATATPSLALPASAGDPSLPPAPITATSGAAEAQ